MKNNIKQIEVNSSILICDSFSCNPPMTYYSINYWNKRKIEFKLAIALILKRYKKTLTEEEILNITYDFKSFVNFFEENLDIIFELIELYLKKTPYKLKDISDELQININKYLSSIDYSESICKLSKDFLLHKRLLYIMKEYERIVKIWNTVSSIKDESYYCEYFGNKILPMIQESNQDMCNFYECSSIEIDNLFKKIKKVDGEENKLTYRIGSDGWIGHVFILGKLFDLMKLGELLTEFYDSNEKKGTNIANYWISDDVQNYCYWSLIGGHVSVLNPVYETFMILDLK